jgi:hypothetical protein
VQHPAAQIELTRSTVDSVEVMVAKVTTNGHPVSHAVVDFSVSRTFGFMPVGEDTTQKDGTATIGFPVGLPIDIHGDLIVRVAIQSPPELMGPPLDIKLSGGAPRAAQVTNATRALWSSEAPLPLIATIVFLLLCVWSTYTFVVVQLIAMRRVTS